MDIWVYDDYTKTFPSWVKPCRIKKLVENAGLLSIHLRYCDSSKDIIDIAMMRKMKTTSYYKYSKVWNHQ